MDTSKPKKRQKIQWTLVNEQKDRQCNGHQQTDKKTDNTMDTSKRTKRQTIQLTLVNGQKTDNTMDTSTRPKRQTIQWTLVNRQKDRQYNGHQ